MFKRNILSYDPISLYTSLYNRILKVRWDTTVTKLVTRDPSFLLIKGVRDRPLTHGDPPHTTLRSRCMSIRCVGVGRNSLLRLTTRYPVVMIKIISFLLMCYLCNFVSTYVLNSLTVSTLDFENFLLEYHPTKTNIESLTYTKETRDRGHLSNSSKQSSIVSRIVCHQRSKLLLYCRQRTLTPFRICSIVINSGSGFRL